MQISDNEALPATTPLAWSYLSDDVAQSEDFENIDKLDIAQGTAVITGMIGPRYSALLGQAAYALDEIARMRRFWRSTLGHLCINLIGCPIVHNKAVKATLS